MPHMRATRYAVCSCHVERPLDDECWSIFASLQARRPGGFRVAALMRPPDASAGEDEERWLERARQAAAHGPLGHHTHFVSPQHARPRSAGPEHAERVRRETGWLRARGLDPTLFCGGGWYMDADIAATLAELGYADCSATAFRPSYLAADAPRLSLTAPARVVLPGGAGLLELPSTHSLGRAARALPRLASAPEPVHVYFHDTDLLSTSRRMLLELVLRLLGRLRRPVGLDELAREAAASAPEVAFEHAFAGRNRDAAQ
jgi:hypothetical protein